MHRLYPFIIVTQIQGKENLPPSDRAVVYVANHQSFLVRAPCLPACLLTLYGICYHIDMSKLCSQLKKHILAVGILN